ncbi:SsrA-binding protein SmpB [Candidatus Schneideria nysicola]|nr:SsrA-binding protein SmpB [Candidatus Schneideria nysicola]
MNKIIIQNKQAYHKYFIEKEFKAGILLEGWEVKSLRAHKVSIVDGYVFIKKEEVFLYCTISPLLSLDKSNNMLYQYNSIRPRKLLLKREEINFLSSYVKKKGYTVILLSLFWKDQKVKATISLARGKKKYDKRIILKEREWRKKKLFLTKYKKNI